MKKLLEIKKTQIQRYLQVSVVYKNSDILDISIKYQNTEDGSKHHFQDLGDGLISNSTHQFNTQKSILQNRRNLIDKICLL